MKLNPIIIFDKNKKESQPREHCTIVINWPLKNTDKKKDKDMFTPHLYLNTTTQPNNIFDTELFTQLYLIKRKKELKLLL